MFFAWMLHLQLLGLHTSLIQLQQTKSHIVPSSFLLIVPEPVYLIASLKRVNLSHNQITEVSTLIG